VGFGNWSADIAIGTLWGRERERENRDFCKRLPEMVFCMRWERARERENRGIGSWLVDMVICKFEDGGSERRTVRRRLEG
jgi:hypothetical protein